MEYPSHPSPAMSTAGTCPRSSTANLRRPREREAPLAHRQRTHPSPGEQGLAARPEPWQPPRLYTPIHPPDVERAGRPAADVDRHPGTFAQGRRDQPRGAPQAAVINEASPSARMPGLGFAALDRLNRPSPHLAANRLHQRLNQPIQVRAGVRTSSRSPRFGGFVAVLGFRKPKNSINRKAVFGPCTNPATRMPSRPGMSGDSSGVWMSPSFGPPRWSCLVGA
jgi:hypothetical protein